MRASSNWRVAFTRKAEEDIKSILAYMVAREGPDVAEAMLEQFISARDSLRLFPERGRIPPEMLRVTVFSYREIQIKPYRIVYQIDKTAQMIFIHIVADARRNIAELLKERLLNAVAFENE